jgi:hypothetical protein
MGRSSLLPGVFSSSHSNSLDLSIMGMPGGKSLRDGRIISEEGVPVAVLFAKAFLESFKKGGRINQGHFEKGWQAARKSGLHTEVRDVVEKILVNGSLAEKLHVYLRSAASMAVAQLGEGRNEENVAHQLNVEAFQKGVFRETFSPNPGRREAIRAAGIELAQLLAADPRIQAARLPAPDGNELQRTPEIEKAQELILQQAAEFMLLVGIGIERATDEIAVPPEFSDFFFGQSGAKLGMTGVHLPVPRAILLNSLYELMVMGIDAEGIAACLTDTVAKARERLDRDLHRLDDDNRTIGVRSVHDWIALQVTAAEFVESCALAFLAATDFPSNILWLGEKNISVPVRGERSEFGELVLKELLGVGYISYQHDEKEPFWVGFSKLDCAAVRRVYGATTASLYEEGGRSFEFSMDENDDIAPGVQFLDAPVAGREDEEAQVVYDLAHTLRSRLVEILELHSELLLFNTDDVSLLIYEEKGKLFTISRSVPGELRELLSNCGWRQLSGDAIKRLSFQGFDPESDLFTFAGEEASQAEPNGVDKGKSEEELTHGKRKRRLTFEQFVEILESQGVVCDGNTGGEHPVKLKFQGKKWPISGRFIEWDAIFSNMLFKAARHFELDLAKVQAKYDELMRS